MANLPGMVCGFHEHFDDGVGISLEVSTVLAPHFQQAQRSRLLWPLLATNNCSVLHERQNHHLPASRRRQSDGQFWMLFPRPCIPQGHGSRPD